MGWVGSLGGFGGLGCLFCFCFGSGGFPLFYDTSGVVHSHPCCFGCVGFAFGLGFAGCQFVLLGLATGAFQFSVEAEDFAFVIFQLGAAGTGFLFCGFDALFECLLYGVVGGHCSGRHVGLHSGLCREVEGDAAEDEPAYHVGCEMFHVGLGFVSGGKGTE